MRNRFVRFCRETAKDAAEAASRAKSDFLATMSHEVRTPLNGVIGMAELLTETKVDEQQRRMVETIHQSGNALLSVITDILDFSKMEAGRFDLETGVFPLAEVVDSAVLIVVPRARKKALTLTAQVAPEVAGQYVGDRNRLRQVLLNLLSNAVKFTLEGAVTLTVTPAPDAVGLCFSVEDTGIGIPPEKRPLLFQEFTQLDPSPARRFGGTGLGLAISRRLVEMMGGTIDVDSVPGRGSRFWFTVPLTRALELEAGDHPAPGAALGPTEAAPRPAESTVVVPLRPAPAPEQGGPRVLVVDDEAVNLRVISETLRDRCFVETVNDGPTALARLARDPLPDLVLLDAMMPGLDGFAVCRGIKADPRTEDVPVIFITAMTQVETEMRGLAAGAVDYVTKPISPGVLLARVNTHLSLCEARRALADRNRDLEHRVEERTHQLTTTQDVTIRALASLAETRDNETGNHIRRTQHYVRVLAEALADHPRFAAVLDDETIDLLFKSAPLHDIGKVGIPDSILLKPDRLTDDEMEIMKTHAALGRDALRAAANGGGPNQTDFLRLACDIAGGHHEKWDGTGYPDGLSGEAIPFAARLMAVADVYDALISARCYKPAFPHEKAVAIIREGRGTQFDPAVADAFLARADSFAAIAARYSDASAATADAGNRRRVFGSA
ncbi:ATP-binding protein [uncultured Rhodospira sp.]|uniref:ATP-binding protein n=1 Tax=uncultured Rhodospira sp. TaxID=1936189 RepID=UPI003458DC3A